MHRDIFRRGVRMTHKFGTLEDACDPFNPNSTFELPVPVEPKQSSPPVEVQDYGEHQMFGTPRNPVTKPNGSMASFNGPAPDWAQALASPVPVSTKKRKDHLATDK
jgi:hypothetical protein